MQKLGISVYIGLGQSFEQNVSFLKLARQCGYSELFTSMHIPESDPASTALEARRLLLQAGELGFGVTADVSPRSWEVFGFKPTELKAMGISQPAVAKIEAGKVKSLDTLKRYASAVGCKVRLELVSS